MDGRSTDQQVNKYLRQLYDDNQEIRIIAIDQLGEIGDEPCLAELRKQLNYVNKEHLALIIAVGKLNLSELFNFNSESEIPT
jgi:HEAT repeat protein